MKMKKILTFLIIINFLNIIIGFIIEKSIGISNEITLDIIYKSIAYILDIPLIYYFIKNNKNEKYFEKKEKISFVNFISYFALMIFFIRIMEITFYIFEIIIKDYSSDMLSDDSRLYIGISFFLTIAVAPVIEEMIFRGVIMNDLKKYGYKTAIIINSIIFGMAHISTNKVMLATLSGIVYSYVAYRYSLKYSILLHMIWNLNAGIAGILYYNKISEKIIALFMVVTSLFLLFFLIIGIIKKKYKPIFLIFRFETEDRKNIVLFFKNNAIFLIIVLVIFFLSRYIRTL